ncbi:MAG TPA: asparagine synthase (glutamine-hydrolyzing) [Pyrinomonadaceae bacterium]|jgi:asparagine synthase (glutamine-hydrolysing)|nr:asparagine synthase (glutamine-hydrolyzing) [Pyrinomonadaceae bacterium]
MCGICGVVDLTSAGEASALVRRMNPTMLHRGPDDEGYFDHGSLSLGTRRLSIIDIDGGHQPMFNEDGTVGVVLNGEIYNFKELQRQLKELGHTFRTRSDSEVVAHAYQEWGPACVGRFEGMFAIAVYDGRRQRSAISNQQSAGTRSPEEAGGTLFLARDRLGIKPLYYTIVSNQQSAFSKLLFASEVRTLLASGVVARKLSRAAVESYLLFGSVSEPMTLIEGVVSLSPGHHLTVALGSQSGSISVERYWNLACERPRNGHAKETEIRSAAKQVRSLLEQSVRSHLIADVPVGVFLSSGIDSTALAALASREVSGVHTFTVDFPEDEFSEAIIARRTAKRLGTTHQEVMLSGDEMLSRLGQAIEALDLPTIDGINTYFVSAAARQAGLKVALSGLGGDEVFGGYSTFRRTPQYQRLARAGNHVPAGLKTAMSVAMAEAGGRFMPGDAARKIAAIWQASDSLPDPYYFSRLLFTPPQVSELMNGTVPDGRRSLWWDWLAGSALQARQLDSFGAVSYLELQSYLVNTLLRDADSMSMAHSLEVRVPFLDHQLVEFVTHLPQEVKLNKGTPKALLVAALEDLLPPEIVHQTKRGFTFPWETWLRGPLKQKVENGLSELSPTLAETLNGGIAQEIWQSYLHGKTTWSRPWSLYVLNEWTKKHLD